MSERAMSRARASALSALWVGAVLSQGSAAAEATAGDARHFQDYQNDSAATAKRFDDYQKITTVLKQYIVAIDTLDENLYSGAFAEKDASIEIRDVVRHGREEIKLEITSDKDARAARVAKATAAGEAPPAPMTTFHMMSNSHIVFIDRDHARHNAYYQVWARQNDHPGGVVRLTTPITLMAIGRYDDDLVRVGGKWLIQKRRIIPDTAGGF